MNNGHNVLAVILQVLYKINFKKNYKLHLTFLQLWFIINIVIYLVTKGER